MRLHKANFAGLTSPGQQSEMKAILAGAWPPLKPLPVFKYETAEYRATIDFDKKRGEWVCRKISLPSNEVQELRGGLRAITLALPHGEAETWIESAEQQEPELERETNRRLQAIREWKEKYQNGARYFELRGFLSERQRTELDDSLRLSLTARQLQFNPKNAANVFDDLSVAGGRFAALIDLAKRKKENQGMDTPAQEEGPQGEECVPDAEPALDRDQQSEGVGSLEIVHVQNEQNDASSDDEPVPIEEAAELPTADEFLVLAIKDVFPEQEQSPLAERMVHAPTQLETETTEVFNADSPTEADEFPALAIKDVVPEQEPAPLAERRAHPPAQSLEVETAEVVEADSPSEADEFPAVTIKNVSEEPERIPLAEWLGNAASQPYETEASEILDEGSASLVEPPPEEERRSPAIRSIGAQARRDRSFFKRIEAADRAKDLSSEDRIEDSYSRFPALRISAFQVNIFAILFLFAVTSFTVGLTVGRGPLGKRLREPPKSLLAADNQPPALPDASSPVLLDQADESTPQTPAPPVASSDDSADADRAGEAPTSEGKSEADTPSAAVSGLESVDSHSAEVVPTDADSSPRTEPRPPAKPGPNSQPGGAMGPIVRDVLPPARSKFIRPHKAVRSISRAPRSHVPYRLTSTFAEGPHLPRASAILVTVPGGGSQPFKVSFPEKTIAATSSLAMTSQLSVFVSAEPGPTLAHGSARLEAGELVSFGWPRYPTPGNRYGSAQTIRVRASIGQLGQVEDVKFLSGSAALLPATKDAIRQWRYTPTLLERRPVQAQQDITIEFRPPQYSSQLRTQHLPHN